MTTAASYLTPEQLAETIFEIRDYLENPKNPYLIDRRQMPWHSMLQKMSKAVPFIRNQVAVRYKQEATDLDMQIWYNKDRLRFQEWRVGFDLLFNGTQIHMGLELWHQELKDSGYVIVPNGPRSENFAGKMSKAEALRLWDTVKEKLESAMDRWDILVDQKFLFNISGDPLEPVALMDLISKTPTVGTYGSRTRSDPAMQNPVVLTSTAASFERDMNGLMRQSMLYNRGFKGAGVNVIMASGGWIDRYSDAVKDSSRFRFNADINKPGPVDIGIPDTQWSFNNVPVVFNPTMDLMAQLTGDASWSRRAIGINTKSFVWGHGEKEDKEVTVPLDPSDQRVTRMSIDGRYMLYSINPRTNFIHEFAA